MRERTSEPFEPVYADASASYVQEYRFDVSKLQPLVAAPHSPDNRKNAADCRDVKIDRVYIGCAGRLCPSCVPEDCRLIYILMADADFQVSFLKSACNRPLELLCIMRVL